MSKINSLGGKFASGLACVFLTAGGLLGSSSSYAFEDTKLGSLLDLSLDDLMSIPIVTASRQVETRHDTPAHVMVITRNQIQDRRYKNLADLLEDLPGVDFQRGTKSSQYNQFTMQGNLGPNRLLILMDGVRVAHPSGGNYPIAENMALYMAKQVEVLYGPAAALYGADAVSGVINIITEAGNGEENSWVSAGAGNYGAREASFMSGFKGEDIKLSLGGHFQKSDRADLSKKYPDYYKKVDYSGSPDSSREDYISEIDSYSIFARFDYKDDLTLGYNRHKFSNLTSLADPYQTVNYDKDAFWAPTTDTIYLKKRFDLSDSLEGTFQADYSLMKLDLDSGYNGYYTDYVLKYGYSESERLAAEQTFNWKISDTHKVQAGVGGQRYYSVDVDALPESYKSLTSHKYDNNSPMQLFDLDYHNISSFMQWQARWTEKFSTTAGLRFDHHSVYGNTFNPRLGAVYKLSEKHVFKALYGEAFRAPSSEEMLRTYGSIEDGTNKPSDFHLPNLDLEPEKVKTVSFVWDWSPTKDVNLVTNIYASQTEDLIDTDYSNPLGSVNINGINIGDYSIKNNSGKQTHYGLDLSGQYNHRFTEKIRADIWGSFSWVKGEKKDQGVIKEIPYVAEFKAKLGATFRYSDFITVTPKIRWTSDVTHTRTKGPDTGIPAKCTTAQTGRNLCKTKGYAVADLHLGWHKLLDGHASIWLDVYNVTDKRYYAAAGSGSTTFWDLPQQPRTWMLSFMWQF